MSENVSEGSIGRGVKPAVNWALQMINNNDDILPDHELAILANDTKVCVFSLLLQWNTFCL